MAEVSRARRALRDIAAGSFSSMVAVTATHPLDTIKTRMQVSQLDAVRPVAGSVGGRGPAAAVEAVAAGGPSAMAVGSQLLRKEGVVGLYRGVSAPLMGATFMSAGLFFAYGQARASTDNALLAGGLTAFASAPIRSPWELLKCQMQVERRRVLSAAGAARGASSSSSVEAARRALQSLTVMPFARQVVREHGASVLLRGTTATLARDLPGNAMYFASYEYGKRLLTPAGEAPSSSAQLLAGGVAGVVYWTAVYPLDVVKTRIQSDVLDPKARQYRGMAHCARETLRQEGAAAFVRGMSPTLLRAFAYNSCAFLAYEKASALLRRAGLTG